MDSEMISLQTKIGKTISNFQTDLMSNSSGEHTQTKSTSAWETV